MALPQIQCFVAPCNPPLGGGDVWTQPPILASAPVGALDRGIYIPQDFPQDTPIFRTETNELDKYRALFLVLGILIGAIFLRGR